MASIKDISRELGLGVSTVSMALNDNPKISKETRELVKAKAKELKYVKSAAAVDLAKKKTNIILLVVNDASRAYFTEVIEDLQSATAINGYDLLISTTYGNHDETAIRLMREHRVDAVIIYTNTISDDVIRDYASEDLPIIVLGRLVEGNPNVYSFEYSTTIYPLPTVKYLIEKGHKHIAFVKGSSVSLGTSRSFIGYKKALEEAGIPYEENLVFDAHASSQKAGYQITSMAILPQIKKIDAICAANDDLAIGCLFALKDHHIRVPEDVSITGQHNIPLSAYVTPSITTVGNTNRDKLAIFYEDMVRVLCTIIDKHMDMELFKHLKEYRSDSKLIERESVMDRTK